MPSIRACLTIVVFTVSSHVAISAQTTANATPEDQVSQLERDWLAAEAKGDSTAFDRIVADDFIGSAFNGMMLSKQDIMPQEGNPGGLAGVAPSDTSVRVFGNTAVLIGFLIKGDLANPTRTRVTLVCQKRAQRWQIVAAEMARM
jgi:ketosteroid isomerase-like protein